MASLNACEKLLKMTNVVVYRSKYNANAKKWGKVNENDPMHVDDVRKCHKKKKFISIMSSVFFPKNDEKR